MDFRKFISDIPNSEKAQQQKPSRLKADLNKSLHSRNQLFKLNAEQKKTIREIETILTFFLHLPKSTLEGKAIK